MNLIPLTKSFEGGWRAESIGKPWAPAVIVGDRAVPQRIDLSHPGAGGEPAIFLELEFVEGVPRCRSISLTAQKDGQPVRPVDLNAAQKLLLESMDTVFAAFAWRVERTGKSTYAVFLEESDESFNASLVAVTRTRRPRKVDRAFLQRVAEIYRENIGGKPTEAVAADLGVAHRTAASYVKQARDAKPPLLPPTTKGKKQA